MAKKKDLSSAAAMLGSKGGKKTAANMTPQERSERGRMAVTKRWEKKKAEENPKQSS